MNDDIMEPGQKPSLLVLVNYDNDFRFVCHSKQGNSAGSKGWTPLYEELLCIKLKGHIQEW